jgi:hypothetical protein
MRWLLLVLGVVLVLAGIVWTLQGLNVMGGSAMSGKSVWTVIGPITALVGVLVTAAGLRRRS